MKIPAILDFSYFPFKKGVYKKGTEEFQALKEMSQSEDWSLYITEMKAKGISINSMRLTEASKADDQFVVNNLQSDEKEIDTGTLCENEENFQDEEIEVEELNKFHDEPIELEEGVQNDDYSKAELEELPTEELIRILEEEFDTDIEGSNIDRNDREDLVNCILHEQIEQEEISQFENHEELDEAHVAGEIQVAAQKAKDLNPGLNPEEINKKNTEQAPIEEGYRENPETQIKEDVQPTAPLQDFKGFDDVKPGDKATCYEKLGWTVLAKGTKQDWNDLKQHDSGVMQGVIDGASEDEDFEMIAVEDPERGKAVFVYGNEGAVVPTISDSEQTEEENPQEAPAFNDHEVQENNPELPIDDESPIGDNVEEIETPFTSDGNEKPEEEKELLDENKTSDELSPEIDGFLQDIAQMTEAISYNDITKFATRVTPEQVEKLEKIHRKWTNYEGDEIEFMDEPEFKELVNIVKGNKIMESTENKNKDVLKEDNNDDKRIQSAFVTFANAKKALEQAQTEITINLGYHFTTLFQAQLTQLNETIESARKQIEVIAKEARTKLKR
jgi:hypothetical protein